MPLLAIKFRDCTTNTSAGAFFKHNETNSFKGREKCSSNCGGNTKKLNISIELLGLLKNAKNNIRTMKPEEGFPGE